MKKLLFLICFLLSTSAFGNVFDGFPLVSTNTADGCEIENGCIPTNRIVSHQGFYTSADEGTCIPNPNVPGAWICWPNFSVDDTGAVNAYTLSVSDWTQINGWYVQKKAEPSITCNGTGPLDLTFTGDYYVVHVADKANCIITGITGNWGSGSIPDGKILRLRFDGSATLVNEDGNLANEYSPMKLKGSQDKQATTPFSIDFTKDGDMWWQNGVDY